MLSFPLSLFLPPHENVGLLKMYENLKYHKEIEKQWEMMKPYLCFVFE